MRFSNANPEEFKMTDYESRLVATFKVDRDKYNISRSIFRNEKDDYIMSRRALIAMLNADQSCRQFFLLSDNQLLCVSKGIVSIETI